MGCACAARGLRCGSRAHALHRVCTDTVCACRIQHDLGKEETLLQQLQFERDLTGVWPLQCSGLVCVHFLRVCPVRLIASGPRTVLTAAAAATDVHVFKVLTQLCMPCGALARSQYTGSSWRL